ncbi:MAG: polymerase sigma factor, sigma-70 family [Bacteroidetes bacterium]|jgi:RNA polymerase sigma-70 factor (ECF subfamily)|nr:polymerase sigma factor, sigma-70 family [Bacteroidota bacterium]
MIYNDKYNHFSDNELITEYKATKNNVFVGILYKRYSHLVLGLSLKYLKDMDEAKDAVMQIFEKLLSDLLKHNIEYFKSWLYTLSKNHCLMILRTKQSRLKKDIDLQVNAGSFMETESNLHPNNAEEKEKQYTLLEKAIDELNEDQKKCIELFYLKEKSYNQIVDMTGYSLNEVKSFIQNGKRNLKIKLEKNSE